MQTNEREFGERMNRGRFERALIVESDRYDRSETSAVTLPPISDQKNSEMAADYAVLSLATILPVILNIRHLGFYADDLGNIGRFQGDRGATVADCFRILYALPGTRGRPAMDLYLAVMFRMFGTHAIGYHIVNAVVIFASAVLFYLSLRLALKQRFFALIVPLIFVSLPNYSSARFVPCTFMIGLSLAFFLLNLYALLITVSKPTLSAAWSIVTIVSILASGLLYEMLLPLFVLNLLAAWIVRRRNLSEQRLRVPALIILFVTNMGALFSVVIFKMLTATRPHQWASVSYVINQALLVHFYKLGLRLPIVAAKAILFYANPGLDILALIFAGFIFWYCFRLLRTVAATAASRRIGLYLLGFGILIFTFALTIFVASGGATGFTATGFENRTAIGVSVGMAFIIPGVLMLLASLVKIDRTFSLPLLIALLCFCELMTTSTIGSYWAEAADRQALVLSSIHQDIPTMPTKTALLVDGVCPYIGPGIVFEGHQDMGGAVQMLYGDPTLRGDVVNSQMLVHDDGIETSIYGRYRFYKFGTLKVYDVRRRKAWDLPDFEAALAYFGQMGPAHKFCPEGGEGEGVPIF